ncbi:MAG: hypothetical protein HEQ40_06950 [Lacibacter sp.]|jgi:hypothetical protein
MNLIDLQNAIAACDAGLIIIQNRTIRAFLYNKKWYPVRSVVNYAQTLAGATSNLTTEEAQTELLLCLNYVNVKNIRFLGGVPVKLVPAEISNNITILQGMINDLQN